MNTCIFTIIVKLLYNKTSFNTSDLYINIPWILTSIVFPLYIIFGSIHNEQIQRAYRIQGIISRLNINHNPPDEDCAICLESLPIEICIETICCHKCFHLKCIKDVIIITNTCPLCRGQLSQYISSNYEYTDPFINV